MAVQTFKGGKLEIEGVSMPVTEITLAVEHDRGDITKIGDSWESGTALASRWTLSGSSNYDPDETTIAALRTQFLSTTDAQLILTTVAYYNTSASGSTYFSGSAMITTCDVVKSLGSVDKLTYTFVGQGALSYTA